MNASTVIVLIVIAVIVILAVKSVIKDSKNPCGQCGAGCSETSQCSNPDNRKAKTDEDKLGYGPYKILLTVEGMSCEMCETHINDTIRKNFKVKKVKSERNKNLTTVISDELIDEEALHAAIDPTGYTLSAVTVEPYTKKGIF